MNWRNSIDGSGNLKTYDDSQWHLKAVSNGMNSAMRFLVVLQPGQNETMNNIPLEFAEQRWLHQQHVKITSNE